MGTNYGSGFESVDLAGEILDIDDIECDFDCMSCEDEGIILFGTARGEACACEVGMALVNDDDEGYWLGHASDAEADGNWLDSIYGSDDW